MFDRISRAVKEAEEATKTAKALIKKKNEPCLIFIPPSLVPIQDMRQMSIKTMKNGNILGADFVQDLFDVAEAIVCAACRGKPLDIPEIVENPKKYWSDGIPELPAIAVYGENKPRRLPITLALRRVNPSANCVTLLKEALLKTHVDIGKDEYKFILSSFSDACTMDDVLYRLMPTYVKTGTWKPSGLVDRTLKDPRFAIIWTCVTRIAILEILSLDYDKKDIAYCAHACMQMHCPLAIYVQTLKSYTNDNITQNKELYDCVYPNPGSVCWASSCWDISPILSNGGFFPNYGNKQPGGRRKRNEKKNDFTNPDHVSEQMIMGFRVLQSIFFKALPVKCVIRGMVDKIIQETKVDNAIGNILVEIFYCSMLGGYPNARFRPSFVGLMHLYEEFFVYPMTTMDRLEWFLAERKDERDDFLFDEHINYRHLWEGHHAFDTCSDAYRTNEKRGWSTMAVHRELNEERRRNFGSVPSLGKATGKRTKDSRNLQKLLMLTFQEMMGYTVPNVPALFQVIAKTYKWIEIMDNVTWQMDTIRRCIDSAIRIKHLNANRMCDSDLEKDMCFKEYYDLAWPPNVFIHTTLILQNRENNPYQWHKSAHSFDVEILNVINKIDAKRRTAIETFNTADRNTIPERTKDIVRKWGIWDPSNLKRVMYWCDYLEFKDPLFVRWLSEFKVLSDVCHVIPEMPSEENVLFGGGLDIDIVKKLRSLHKNKMAEPETKQLTEIMEALDPDDYVLIGFFYNNIQKRRSIQIYRMPQNILEKQQLAVMKKYKKTSLKDLLPSMTTYLICPCCDTFKAYLANADPRDVTAFGNAMAAVDPLTGKVYCANKVKKQSSTRQDKDHSEIKFDTERHNRKNTGGQLDPKDQKRHNRMYTCHWKSREKNEIQTECNNTELIPINLLGTWLLHNESNYVLCMNCGSPMQITSSCYKGDGYSCGNCTNNSTVTYNTCCAQCSRIFFSSEAEPIPISSETKRIIVKSQLDARQPGLMDMPVYEHSWVAHNIFDDSSDNGIISEIAFSHANTIPAPKIASNESGGDPWNKTIYLCPDHDKEWMIFIEHPVKWSILYTGITQMWSSWYCDSSRTYMARELSKSGLQRVAHNERSKMMKEM